jgi:hypothetical protein
MTSFDNFISAVEALKVDAQKFYEKENSAAGTRLRKGLQAIRKQAQELRKEVTAVKEARKKA